MMKYLRSKATIVSLLAGFCGIILILWAWQLPPFVSSIKTTNNAYIQAEIHYVHSAISGTIDEVLVDDYQMVQKGDPLFILKDSTLKEEYAKALANFRLKQIALEKGTQADALTMTQLQQEFLLAKAYLEIADLNLQSRVVTASTTGRLGEIKIKPGQYITKATDLTTILTNKIWVIALYKETDIANMKVGQVAKITVDALAGQEFNAHITAIGSATTAEFSAQKPDMSNQNYIKITKRISVQLDLDENQENLDKLISGLSVTSKIDTK